MQDIVVVGAGGFGRETLDVIAALNSETPTWNVLGTVDDAPSQDNLTRLYALDVPYLGRVDDLPAGVAVAVAIGDPWTRTQVATALAKRGHPFPTLVHPSSIVGSEFHHGEGLIMLGGVCVGTNVHLGDHVHLNAHSVIGHDVRLLDFVSVNPNATVSGECVVGPRTLLGASSTVLQQITLAEDVTIGAGALVSRDVTAGVTAKGVPAR